MALCVILDCVVFAFGSWPIKERFLVLKNRPGNMTDTIAQMLTEIKNAQAVGKEMAEMPFSKLRHEVASILAEKGYLEKAEKVGKKPKHRLRLHMRYLEDLPAVTDFQRKSKPSRRTYVKTQDIPVVLGGSGLAVLSTSQGIMGGEEARRQNIGGELLFIIW